MEKKNELIAEFTALPKNSNWVMGKVGEYLFQAKLYDSPVWFGIDKGRVGLLHVFGPDFRGDCCIDYDSKWYAEPNEKTKDVYDAIMKLLVNSPKRWQ